jgi:hypothetical protein
MQFHACCRVKPLNFPSFSLKAGYIDTTPADQFHNMGCRRASSEQTAVHHFAGRVLGLALPPIDALFSPIHQVVSPAERYSRGKLHPDKGKPALHLPAAKDGRRTSAELLLVNALTGRSRRTSAEGSHVATPMGIRGSPVTRFGTMTSDLQVIESVTSRSPKSPDLANFYLPASSNPRVKVKTMSTITVLSPTSPRKIAHFPSKSEGL